MKLKSFIFLFFCISNIINAGIIDTLRLREPIEFRVPILVDSIDVKGNKHDIPLMLMENYVSPSVPSTGVFDDIASDTAGLFKIPLKNHDSYALHVLNTKIRSDYYSKIKLKVTTTSRIKIYVNEVLKAEKKKRNDSISLSEACTAEIIMHPGELYNLSLRVLSEPDDKEYIPVKIECVNLDNKELDNILSGTDLKGRYLLENTVFGKRPTRVSVSPNGKYILLGYVEWFDKSRSNSYTVLIESSTGRKLATFTQGSKYMEWMPKSSQLYYTTTSEYGVKVIKVNPETLDEKILADGLPAGGFKWSPDEKSLYYSLNETIEKENKPVYRLLTNSDRVPGFRNRWSILRYNLQNGIRERITAGLHTSTLQDISYDGSHIIYSVYETVPDKWPFGKSSLYLLDINTMQLDTLICEDSFISSARFSPDAKSILIMGGPEALNGIGKNCGKYPIANNYDTQAFIMNLSTREIEAITKDFVPTVSFLQWNKNDGCIYFKATEGIREPIYSYNLNSKSFKRLELEGDCVRAFSLSYDSNIAAYTSVTASTSSVAYVFDVRKNKSKLLANPYSETLEKIELGKINEWDFVASDGTTIDGYYCLPPNFDSTKEYPMIVYYYGGTTPTTLSMDSPYSAQLFASRGYVVYVINPSGTIGYGQEFSARHVNAWGNRTADDIIEGVQAFCDEHEYVNKKRIGCIGASYGGFMTQYLQTKTDLFAAAVSHAGISNVTSYWGEGYWGVGYNAVAAAKSYPWNNPELFVKNGSLFNADKIKTPLLLLHGTADTNVPIGESIQLYNALKILGKEVEFIQVDGENHFISEYSKREMWHNSIMAWFAKWLQNSPSWWENLYPDTKY